MIRLLLVEDSVTQREILRRLLNEDDRFSIVAEARNGIEAIAHAEKYQPDVVLLDLNLPDMNGAEVTQQIMAIHPTSIVIISSTPQELDVGPGAEALQAGAVSVIQKPEGPALIHLEKIAPSLTEELIRASEIRPRVSRHRPRPQRPIVVPSPKHMAKTELIAICTSTGGPHALMKILSNIPKPYPLPILIVQHISSGFVEGFQRWLQASTGQPVTLVSKRTPLQPGIWLSAGNGHLVLRDSHHLGIDPGSPADLHCPSGNAMFESIAIHHPQNTLGIILTGMGNDGAAGLGLLRNAGGRTVAQNEKSSLIYGMPRAAKESGAADLELSLEGITQLLNEAANPA